MDEDYDMIGSLEQGGPGDRYFAGLMRCADADEKQRAEEVANPPSEEELRERVFGHGAELSGGIIGANRAMAFTALVRYLDAQFALLQRQIEALK